MGFAHKLDLSEQVFLLVSQGKERFSLSFGSEMAQKKVTIQGRCKEENKHGYMAIRGQW